MAANLLAELKRELRAEGKGLEKLDAKAHQQLLDLLKAAHLMMIGYYVESERRRSA